MPLITTHNYFANEVLNDTKNDIKKHFLEKKIYMNYLLKDLIYFNFMIFLN